MATRLPGLKLHGTYNVPYAIAPISFFMNHKERCWGGGGGGVSGRSFEGQFRGSVEGNFRNVPGEFLTQTLCISDVQILGLLGITALRVPFRV